MIKMDLPKLGLDLMLIGMLTGSLGWAQESPLPASVTQSTGVIIDRIVAVVNDEPITESQLLWFLALDPEIQTETFSNEMKHQAMEQYIDRQLLYQEARKLPSIEVTAEEIRQYLSDLTAQFPSASAFRQRLQRVGLDERTIQEIARRRLIVLQFIEFRFRAFVFVSDDEIQSYYERRVRSLAEERGVSPPPVDQVRDLIQKNIIEDKVAAEMIAWFEETRRRSDLVYLVEY